MVYIRQHQLPNLKNYKYAGVDHSPISIYILKPQRLIKTDTVRTKQQ